MAFYMTIHVVRANKNLWHRAPPGCMQPGTVSIITNKDFATGGL